MAAPIHGKGPNRTSCASERHVASREHGRHDRRSSEFENESSKDVSIARFRRMSALLTGKTTMTWLPFDVCQDFGMHDSFSKSRLDQNGPSHASTMAEPMHTATRGKTPSGFSIRKS